MNLNETKIVIIDDIREDVKNLLKYFDKRGVPYNYYFEDADIDNLPDKPLSNVRLIFLDFVLGNEGQTERAKIATLMTVLKRILKIDNGPYIILAWTKNNNPNRIGDLLPPFKKELYSNMDIPRPIEIIDLDKINIMRNLGKIEKKLKDTFNGENIFEILLGWESKGKLAVADVVNTVNEISLQNIPATLAPATMNNFFSELRKNTEKNMYKFAESVSGEDNLSTNNNILIDAQIPLGGIFQDLVEGHVRKQTPELKKLSRKIYSSRKKITSTHSESAQMNTYFLLSQNPESSPKPGNIYKVGDVSKKIPKSIKIPFRKSDFLNQDKIVKDMKKCKDDAVKILEFKRKLKGFQDKIIPIFIEITPDCDYVQKKWKGARFVYGVLCPDKFLDNVEDTKSYILDSKTGKIFPRLAIKYESKNYFFLLDSSCQCILPLPLLSKVKPILRARKELLVDIQHWVSAQASRPGKTEF